MGIFSDRPKREPSAANRKAAADMHELYVSYVEAGFSRQQAMEILREMIRAGMELNSRRDPPPG